ncbi:hypothetical protein [Psychrobacter sp. Pi2-51]|uniref:hypothetical protein n=1 Tax=Psychrobacter TaxID=497 RepID=UPI0019183F98|nr:hypothetical protein [Psychrobacter sp. Pi2-51]
MHKYTIEDEKQMCSKYSPGIILCSEELYRITLHPEHISSEGDVLPSAISTADLECRGFSVERKEYSSTNIICDIADKQIQSKEAREYAEVAKLECGKIRTLNYEQTNDRSFLVIDDALENNIAHASIYSAMKTSKKSILRKLRTQLSPFLKNRVSLDSLTT